VLGVGVDSELAVVAKAQAIIDVFNKAGVSTALVYLNRPAVWTFLPESSWAGKKALVEPLIQDFVKWNSNSGWSQHGIGWADIMQVRFSID
jgi:Alpha-kinase family